jgi:hypothetical protein
MDWAKKKVRAAFGWLWAPMAEPALFNLRFAELVLMGFLLIVFGIVGTNYVEIPRTPGRMAAYSGLFLSLLVLRYLYARYPVRWIHVLAQFAPLSGVFIVYFGLNPIIEIVSPRAKDGIMVAIDQWLVGTQLSVAVQDYVPRFVNDYLALTYGSYYLWPLGLQILLYVRGRHRDFDGAGALQMFTIFLNYLLYIAVPVQGPRYFLADRFHTDIVGLCCAERLYDAWLKVPVTFDCFPSGHTGSTMLTLMLAWHFKERRYFWLMMPFAVGLIAATLLLRFHYVTDLMAAVPIYATCFFLGLRIHERKPHGWVIERRDRANGQRPSAGAGSPAAA